MKSRHLHFLLRIVAICPLAAFADNVNVTGVVIAGGEYIRATNGYVRAGTYFVTPGYLSVGTSGTFGTTLTVGNSASTWLLVKSALYVRDANNNDLFVVSNTGDVTMKKAQGDIGMGQFGN